MKVLVINGSPRHKSNVYVTLEEIVKLLSMIVLVAMVSCVQKESNNVGIPSKDNTEAFEAFAEHFGESESFAYATVSDVKVMLVSQETFGNNMNTDLEAVEASIFALDPKGKIVSLGSIRSQGTLYPVSLLDGKLMVAGHHFVKIYSIRGDIPELVLDDYEDTDGPKLTEMFETFEKGEPIKFERSE